MDVDGDDDDEDITAPIRPYSEFQGESRNHGGGRQFTPAAPAERRAIDDKSQRWTTDLDISVEAILQQGASQDATSSPSRAKLPMNRGAKPLREHLMVSAPPVGPGSTVPGPTGSNVSGPMVAPRPVKQKVVGKSQDLGDLTFSGVTKLVNGLPQKSYAPISLPYYGVSDEESRGLEADGKDKGKQRPTLTRLDEANADAARMLFLGPNGALLEDDLFLVQLPAVLPAMDDPQEDVSSGVGADINRMPDGRLGKLKIHRSGRVTMDIGGINFDVDQGCQTHFQQDIACVCPEAKEVIFLGQVHKRVVLSPDVDSLLAATSLSESGASHAEGLSPRPAKEQRTDPKAPAA